MNISDFKEKHPAALLCPICERRFIQGNQKGKWMCGQHKCIIIFWMEDDDSVIRDVELRFQHTSFAGLWFDLKLETTSYMVGQSVEDFQELLDFEVRDYSFDEIKKIMAWA